MVTYYLDSSALAKRYLVETGDAWIRRITAPTAGNVLIVSRITLVEVASALGRRYREASISAADYTSQLNALRFDVQTSCQVIELNSRLAEEALQLTQHHPLRGYDAVQLASGLAANRLLINSGARPLIFLTADRRLLAIAQAEGLIVDNPNLH